MHFDFPYFHEPGDGLRDEVSSETWARNGNVKFVGEEIPNDEIISGTPKFGYRCPSFSGSSDFLSCTNNTSIFTLMKAGPYEFEFFLRVTSLSAGRIFALKNSGSYTLTLSILADGKLSIAGVASSQAISLNTWAHILTRITGSKILVFLDGTQIISSDFSGAECSSFELGGFSGQVDEFIFRHALSSSVKIPAAPYQGSLSPDTVGGFGNSRHGTQTLTANAQLNTYGEITNADGKKITVSSWQNGKFGAPSVGDEVMIHISHPKGTSYNYLGRYAFRKIEAVAGNTITLDSAINEFEITELLISSYYIQVITVPNFANLTIQSGVTISPRKFDTCGGIVVFRAANNFSHDGIILTSNYGPLRSDNLQLTHAGLIENFILNSGGGVFIAAKNFNASSSSRIGATWDGSGKGGQGGYDNSGGTNGGAGYGGGGGGWHSPISSWGPTSGGNGGVGGGAGAGAGSATDIKHRGNGGNAGNPDRTGGGYGWGGAMPNTGGAQGVTAGGNSYTGAVGPGGGGAGGSCVDTDYLGPSGANVIIIANRFSCDASAISTGGQGGSYHHSGSGSGFCYIAAKELI